MKKRIGGSNAWYKTPKFVVFAMFAVAVLVRFFLSYFSSAGPTVYIDEGLYINIARSLITDGKVMYRAQPVSYVYLLYPIAIMPVFLLPSSINVYRVLQLWNAVMISTIVFPTYLLGRQAKLTREKAYLAAAAALIIPEIGLSTYLVAESLIYPLMMWIFLLGYMTLIKPEKKYLPILFGVLNGVAYFAKPECIVFGACFMVVLCFNEIRKKRNIRRLLLVFSGAGIMAALIVLGYILYGVLFDKATALNLYEKQIPSIDLENVLIMLQGIVFHLYAFAISAGGVFVLIPLIGYKKQTEENRTFFSAFLLAVLAMAIGIGVMIVPYEYDGSWGNCPTHLRYLMYFFPVLFVWLLLPELAGLRIQRKGIILLWVLAVLFVFPSGFSCFTDQGGTYYSPSLNVFLTQRAGTGIGIACVLAITAVNVWLIKKVKKRGWDKKVQKAAVMTAVLFMLLNGTMMYSNSRSIDRDFEQEANEVAEQLADKDFVVFTNNRYDDFRGFQLDAHLHRSAQMVVANNMLLDAVETNGVYRSFTPLTQAPNIQSLPTIETDTILFDVTTADYVEFAEGVNLTQSTKGLYTIAQFVPGQPYLKTAIASMNAYTLSSSDTGSLLVYDQEMLAKGEVTLHISLRSPNGEAQVTFACEGKSQTVTATRETQKFSVTLPITKNDFFHFTISGTDDIIIHEYSTE